jgi:LPS sulfotransferase NodH
VFRVTRSATKKQPLSSDAVSFVERATKDGGLWRVEWAESEDGHRREPTTATREEMLETIPEWLEDAEAADQRWKEQWEEKRQESLDLVARQLEADPVYQEDLKAIEVLTAMRTARQDGEHRERVARTERRRARAERNEE